MKAAAIFALATSVLVLGACQYIHYPRGLGAGNPNHTPYAGEPGSVYDQAANPPMSEPAVSYNPQAPLPPVPEPRALPSVPPAPAAR